MFCLTKSVANEFLRRIKEGEISPVKLNEMLPEEMHAYFSQFMGESNAKQITALFEEKMLRKTKEQTYINIIKRITNLSEPVKRDLISRVQKMENILNPESEQVFKKDLVAQKLGVEITSEEAKKVSELAKDVKTTEKVAKAEGFNNREKNIAYGEAKLKVMDYLDEFQSPNKNLVGNIIGFARSIKVIGDMGVLMRNAWGLMSTKEYWKNVPELFKMAFNKKNYREAQAIINAHPLFAEAKRGGLRINFLPGTKLSKMEEDFMSRFIAKTPILRGIERANVGFLNLLRFERFVTLYKDAEMSAEDVKDVKVLQDLTKTVNDFTGGANVGKNDVNANLVPIANTLIYSLRREISKVNMLLAPAQLFDRNISWTARKARMRQLFGSLAMMAGILGLAAAAGVKVETDSTSADFLKLKIGKQHIDISGGEVSLIVFLSRVLQNKQTSSTTSKVTVFGKGYKAKTRGDLLFQYIRGKFAPASTAFTDWFVGQDRNFQKPTALSTTKTLFWPMTLDNAIQEMYQNPKDERVFEVLGTIMDYFGNSTQKY